jgi:hypothetical protein
VARDPLAIRSKSPAMLGLGPLQGKAVQPKNGRSIAWLPRYAPAGICAATWVVCMVIVPMAPDGAVQRSSATSPALAPDWRTRGPPWLPHEGAWKPSPSGAV